MKYLNILNKDCSIGGKKLELIFNHFKSWEKAYHGKLNDFLDSGLNEKSGQSILQTIQKFNPDKEWEKLEKNNIKIITREEPDFPQIILETKSAPYLLYQKGDLDLNKQKFIAIVGSRKHTSYGEQVAQKISSELTQAGFTVISGLALGIDAIAHEEALAASGKTVAVLGSSLDNQNISPRYNFNLSQRVIQSGCLLSEYSPETPASAFSFPMRNRIIAGLSLGVVIIEAAEKSGSLITASLALENNREVFAIPGEIFSSQSVGTNKLIRDGAKITTCLEDILEEFNFVHSPQKKLMEKKPANETEEKIIKVLSNEPLHVDNIAKITTLETMAVLGTLSVLEIKGWVKNIGGQNYILL